MRPSYSVALIATLPLLLAACSTVGSRAGDQPAADANAYVAFDSSSRLAVPADRDAGLLAGRIEAGSAEQRMRYNVAYRLESDVLTQSLMGETGVPAELGRQSVRQEINLELPPALGAPIQINMLNQQDLQWSFNGDARTDSQRAQLHWQPDHFVFDLRWTPPDVVRVSNHPMGCYVQANLHLPKLPMAKDHAMAMDVSGQACEVHAPARGVVGLAARHEGMAWRWGDGFDSTLRLKRVQPSWQEIGAPEIEPAYEVGLSQGLSLAGWEMGLDMAWRQVDQTEPRESLSAPARWAMNFMLERDLGLVALKARWLYANDPLWFVPLASPVERERLSLLLDFSKWLANKLPGMEARMSASWEQVEDARGVDDHQVQWNVELTW